MVGKINKKRNIYILVVGLFFFLMVGLQEKLEQKITDLSGGLYGDSELHADLLQRHFPSAYYSQSGSKTDYAAAVTEALIGLLETDAKSWAGRNLHLCIDEIAYAVLDLSKCAGPQVSESAYANMKPFAAVTKTGRWNYANGSQRTPSQWIYLAAIVPSGEMPMFGQEYSPEGVLRAELSGGYDLVVVSPRLLTTAKYAPSDGLLSDKALPAKVVVYSGTRE